MSSKAKPIVILKRVPHRDAHRRMQRAWQLLLKNSQAKSNVEQKTDQPNQELEQ